jgi:diacylglycerol kinase
MRPPDCTDKNANFFDSTLSAACGFWDAVRKESKVRQVVVASVLALSVAGWARPGLVLFIFTLGAWVLALICELFNTALEKGLDYACKSEIHPLIREGKDYAAACTFVSTLFAAGLTLFILYRRLILVS